MMSLFQLQISAFLIRYICISITDTSNYIEIQISVFIIKDICI